MAMVKAPKTPGAEREKSADKLEVNEEEISKIDCVEGEQAYENFVNLTKRLISVPKSEIVELERKRKKKT